MSLDTHFENSPWITPGPAKQRWKENEGYYTAKELAEFAEDIGRDIDNGSFRIYSGVKIIDAN